LNLKSAYIGSESLCPVTCILVKMQIVATQFLKAYFCAFHRWILTRTTCADLNMCLYHWHQWYMYIIFIHIHTMVIYFFFFKVRWSLLGWLDYFQKNIWLNQVSVEPLLKTNPATTQIIWCQLAWTDYVWRLFTNKYRWKKWMQIIK